MITYNKFRLVVHPIANGYQCDAIQSRFAPTIGETEELAIGKMKHAIDQWERDLWKAIAEEREHAA